ncbi:MULTISPECIES: hypothetical protein [Anaeromyxobacter]|uniref:hypothetical protein n=1 Tax=Anaeromyxobacter TaxID=161492 RepID=UPI001F57D7DC|nr:MULTISPECIES: hypothetical protein [unclassified Anaeromyxobacter]
MISRLDSPSRPSGARALALAAAVSVVALAGCRSEEIAHYRVPKSSGSAAPAPAASPMMPASGQVPAPPSPVAGSKLVWTLPARWTETTGGGGMRYATLKAPVGGRLDVSVTVLPGEAGGELANVNRWRGQIGLPALDGPALAKARRPLETKAGTVSLYDFTSEGTAKSRVVAGLAVVDGNSWFIKMTGDAGAVDAARPDFLRIVESLRRDASND